MLFRAIGALLCGGLLLLATTAHADQGDPLPGIDVSMEQNPGGIIIAQTTTNGTGNYIFVNVPEDDYSIYVDVPGLGMAGRKAVDVALTISARGQADNVIRYRIFSTSRTKVGIEFKTTALAQISGRIVEGAPERNQSGTGTAQTCLWAGRVFSQGALFCMGPKTALQCQVGGIWSSLASAPCEKATQVDTK
jgi:Carboxypeptidase regulatory-like domain